MSDKCEITKNGLVIPCIGLKVFESKGEVSLDAIIVEFGGQGTFYTDKDGKILKICPFCEKDISSHIDTVDINMKN